MEWCYSGIVSATQDGGGSFWDTAVPSLETAALDQGFSNVSPQRPTCSAVAGVTTRLVLWLGPPQASVERPAAASNGTGRLTENSNLEPTRP